MTMHPLIWYTAYGSNMHATRLGYYLGGGRPPGGRRTYPGCRDPSPPRRTVGSTLPGGIFFAGESPAWTGGAAFYDRHLPGTAAARSYLVTVSQFSDLAAQEMYRPPGTDLDLGPVLERGHVRLGDGRYETMVHAGDLDGHPMITFTAPWSAREAALNAPAARYLEMISSGLHEAHSWSPPQIAAYLAGRPGAAGAWTIPRLTALARRGIELGMLVAAPDPDGA
ncbi:histone deacetylase [Catenuloplanes atrovinosus]|uniref:Histone deacetylase n=1 Tax=Catenuloplanes atrovinosus TaxID=137266 RepID=A0AAE4CEV3_9ACTN|nr:histone deacetylase [Catenuloplanes atrovinosus]MDR7279000.1 hypothetical protein [Catenuloplanes atrovinosus]